MQLISHLFKPITLYLLLILLLSLSVSRELVTCGSFVFCPSWRQRRWPRGRWRCSSTRERVLRCGRLERPRRKAVGPMRLCWCRHRESR